MGTSHPGQFRYRLQPLVPLWQPIQSLRNKGKKESVSKERGEPNKKPSDSHVGNTMPKELHGGPLHGMRHGDVCSGNAVHT